MNYNAELLNAFDCFTAKIQEQQAICNQLSYNK